MLPVCDAGGGKQIGLTVCYLSVMQEAANWLACYLSVMQEAANWLACYLSVMQEAANWLACYLSVMQEAANWLVCYLSVMQEAANWLACYLSVMQEAANWLAWTVWMWAVSQAPLSPMSGFQSAQWRLATLLVGSASWNCSWRRCTALSYTREVDSTVYHE